MTGFSRVRRDRSVEATNQTIRVMNVLNGGTPTVAVELNHLLGGIEDVCSDVVIPNFAEKSAAGQIFNNPFNHTIVTRYGGGGSYYAKHKTQNSIYYNEDGGSVTLLTLSGLTSYPELGATAYIDNIGEIQNLRNNVMLLAVNKIDNTSTNMIEDLLELQETLRTMSHPIATIYDLSRKYRSAAMQLYNSRKSLKRTGRGERTLGNALSTTWLTARFGFAQPVYSLMNLHQAYLERDRDSPTRRRVGAGDFLYFSNDRDVTLGSNTYHVTDNVRQSFNSWYLYTAEKPFTDTFSGHLGLRLKDVPKGLWQVMPSSWVVDRFVDISSFIGAAMKLSDPTIKILSAGYTYKGESTHDIQVTEVTHPDFDYTVTGDKVGTKTSSLQRIPGIPTFNDFLPRLKNPIKGKSFSQNLDLLSKAVANLTSSAPRIY